MFVSRLSLALRNRHVQQVLTCVVVVTTLFAISSVAQAEQVTFEFEATVTDIADANGVAASLPFTPVIGQPLVASVTFTPVGFSQSSSQDGRIDVFFGGESFSATNLRLTTENDVFVAVGSDVQGPFDSLSVSCGVNTQCPSTSTSATGIDVVFLGLGIGGGDVLPAGAPLDTSVSWNLFPNRRLVLTLSDGGIGAPLTIGADFGPVRAVPEPSSLLLLTCLGASFAYRRSHRK